MSGRVVETVFVFDRHAATDLSVAYSILVPERAARLIAAPGPAGPPALVAGQEGRLARDQHREQQHDQHQQHTPQCRGKDTGSRRRTQSPAREGQFELDLELGLGWAAAADRRDLRAGVVGATEEGRDDRVADRGAARVRGRSRADCA
ncbi:MAG TPA: hypothetical protein VHS32_39000 [Streptosporangiaceae bacterium]|nr:hypothetical protein [Streptosporangiaceae bacterium]